MKTIIVILGCMGIGKTTLVQKIKSIYPQFTYVDEPVDEWLQIKDDKGNILDKFYKDKTRWSYTFENIAFITRLTKITDAIEKDQSGIIVLDGSLATDKNVYAQMLYDDGFMTDMEWQAYKIWSNFYDQHIKQHKIHYVALQCDVETIIKRINQRNRKEESSIQPEYLEKVQIYLERWVSYLNTKSNFSSFDFNCEINTVQYNNILKHIGNLTSLS